MKQQFQKHLFIAVILFAVFMIWTAAVSLIDIQAIGPNGSEVGFAAINGAFHQLTGVHWVLYDITDLLGVLPFLFVLGFGFVGLIQLIRRRSLLKVDPEIIVLGIFYIIVLGFFILFQIIEVNYRPVLVKGILETSYPSSTTVLSLCVFPTAILQFRRMIHKERFFNVVKLILSLITVFMVFARLISGVHWFTDIIGGLLLSVALFMFYFSAIEYTELRRKAQH